MYSVSGGASRAPSPTAGAVAASAASRSQVAATEIDALCVGPSRRENYDIRGMIDRASANTRRDLTGLRTSDANARLYSMETTFDARNGVFSIQKSFREVRSNRSHQVPHASDAYLAHLSIYNRGSGNVDRLPLTLPRRIVRDNVLNTDTNPAKRTAMEIYQNHPRDRQGAVQLRLNRQDPSDRANADLYRLLTETANGKSTAHMIKDFNNLQGTEHRIEGATIRVQALEGTDRDKVDITFDISQIGSPAGCKCTIS